MITLSVIIPVYNTRPYLDECLRSLQEQTLRDFEVVMVDDGSTDGSDEVMRRFAGADHRFRCIWQTNSGPSAARNRGLREAQGQYVAFLDCDDWLLSADCMERMCRFMDETGADVAVGHVLSVWPDGRCRTWGEGQEKLFVPGGVTDGGEFFARVWENDCYVPMLYTCVYRRSFLHGHGFVFDVESIHEDELWTPVVLTSARKVVYTDVVHYAYRQREGSIMSGLSAKERAASLPVTIRKLREYALGYADNADGRIRNALLQDVAQLERILAGLRPAPLAGRQLADHWLLHGLFMEDNGLWNGRLGLSLFFYLLWRHTGNHWYEEFAGELLDRVCNGLSNRLPVHFADGLCGTGWGIEWLREAGFIEGDTDDILEEVDRAVMERDVRRMADTGLETGLKGIAAYVRSRLDSPRQPEKPQPFDAAYLQELEEACRRAGIGLWDGSCSPTDVWTQLLERWDDGFRTDSLSWQRGIVQLEKGGTAWKK